MILYLLGVGQIEFGCQVDGLQLDNVLLASERLSHLPQNIRCDFWHPLAVLSHQPQDAGSGHGDLPAAQRRQVTLCWLLQRKKITRRSKQNRTVILSKSLAMSLMMSPCWVGWVCSSFLITTTLSATTVSAKTTEQISKQNFKKRSAQQIRHRFQILL